MARNILPRQPYAQRVAIEEFNTRCLKGTSDGLNRPRLKSLAPLQASDGVRRDPGHFGEFSNAYAEASPCHSTLLASH